MSTPSSPDSGGDLPVLIFGDHRQPALRHEVPIVLPSFPILYLEAGGRAIVAADPADLTRLRALPQVDEAVAFEEMGFDSLLGAGTDRLEALGEVVLRFCRAAGVTEARTPPDLPLFIADALRNGGVDVVADAGFFESRRRRKTPAELAGVERAQRAAANALAQARRALAEGRQTSESIRGVIQASLAASGAVPHDSLIVASGPQGADPHQFGSGPIVENAPIMVDIYPRDLLSGCWGDLTRTLCVGDAPEELQRWHRDLCETQRVVMEAIRPGVTGEELNRIGCEHLAALGYKTPLSMPAGAVPEEGVLHLMGHGVGLEIIEEPTLDEGGGELRAGDVVTVEPALYRPGFGGCRIEDLVEVTEDGYRNLVDCPYGYEVA